MCLLQTIIKNTFHLQQKVATRPILVLKIGYYNHKKEMFVSSIYGKYYEKDVLYTQKLEEPYVATILGENLQNAYIEKGFHSYRELPKHILYRISKWGWITMEKDNSAIIPDVIAIFEIPKGSIYYSDGENHYVSDSIIFRKAIFNMKEWRAENFYSQTEKIL